MILLFLILVFNIWNVHTQKPLIASTSNCSLAQTCGECISISHECKWCKWDQYQPPKSYQPANRQTSKSSGRCSNQFSESQCPLTQQINPHPRASVNIVQDEPFSDSVERTIQLRPQTIRIDVRVGQEVNTKLQFKQATDYPMDLYYLMDISCTMLKHKTSVSRVGKKLASKIQATTKDFRIGFGSYVDKETIPFSNYKFNSKIQCNKQPMVNTYSFINHLPLSSNVTMFEWQVQSAKISGNLDSPEGTLDALMQVMVCGEAIGWRDHSDKIIVVASDESFHYAGDGRLGGILTPNDGRCHLTPQGRYHASTVYDYPSMFHIAEVAQQKKFNLVFTVSDMVAKQYEMLSMVIGGNSRVASLKVNDDTIADLIDEVYRNISNQIELKVEDQPPYAVVEIWSNCGMEHEPLKRTSKCTFFGKAKIEFDIRIMLTHCPRPSINNVNEPDASTNNVIRIGLVNKDEAIEIELNAICGCECEVNGAEYDSPKCSNNGTFSCGICTKCNGIRSGEQCECDPDKPIDPRRPDAHCRPDVNTRPCNGHGQCVCGRCLCEGMFAGQFCQEDQSACYRDGLRCSLHGQCQHSQCICDQGWMGRFCDCPLSNATCITNHQTGELCNGRGECHCGRCKCEVATSMGQYCEHCPQCDHQQHCQMLKTCVKEYSQKFCQDYFDEDRNETVRHGCVEQTCMGQKWSYQWEQIDPNNNPNTNLVNNPVYDPDNYMMDFSLTWYQAQCSQIMNGCVVAFDYRLLKPTFDHQQGLFRLEPETGDLVALNFVLQNMTVSCPIRLNATHLALGSFITVIIAGLICIIVFKCVTNYLDQREYERFQKEIAQANFASNANPLYKEANTQFRNPVFGLRDRTSKFFFNKK